MPHGGRVVPIPGQPGHSIDPRIRDDVVYILRRFKAKVTAGHEGGHSPRGEHPIGLALDLVPDVRRGGTWADLDRLAKWAGWRPGKPSPGKGPFRWVGWNTESNHGKGHHLHLSWERSGKVGGDLPAGAVPAAAGGGGGGGSADPIAALGGVVDSVGEAVPRIAAIAAVVIGAAFLLVIGASRAAGLRQPQPAGGAA